MVIYSLSKISWYNSYFRFTELSYPCSKLLFCSMYFCKYCSFTLFWEIQHFNCVFVFVVWWARKSTKTSQVVSWHRMGEVGWDIALDCQEESSHLVDPQTRVDGSEHGTTRPHKRCSWTPSTVQADLRKYLQTK